MKFKVLRQHTGDKDYAEGDIREANEADVKHLIGKVLAPFGKSEAAPKNKAIKGAPKNKDE